VVNKRCARCGKLDNVVYKKHSVNHNVRKERANNDGIPVSFYAKRPYGNLTSRIFRVQFRLYRPAGTSFMPRIFSQFFKKAMRQNQPNAIQHACQP